MQADQTQPNGPEPFGSTGQPPPPPVPGAVQQSQRLPGKTSGMAVASLVLGIISGFRNNAVGLWSTEWFLIAIALFILGLWVWLVAYAAAKE